MSQINYKIIEQLVNQHSHIREIARELKTNQTTIARKVRELEEQNVVDYKQEGRNKIYSIKNSIEAREHLKIAEYHKLLEIIQIYPRLRQIIEKIQKNNEIKLAILFGSYAKKNPDKESDIDIYIETENKELKKTIGLSDSKLSIKIGKFNKETSLAKEIINNHIILKGVDRYYELVY